MHKAIKHLIKKPVVSLKHLEKTIIVTAISILSLLIIIMISILAFEIKFQNRVYPNIYIGNVWSGGKTQTEIENYWNDKNLPFADAVFEFHAGEMIATVSGTELSMGYDGSLSATQAYLAGRSGNFWSDLKTKFLTKKIDITPLFRYRTEILNQTLDNFAQALDVPAQDALFTFKDGKVTAFKPSTPGLKVNIKEANLLFNDAAGSIPDQIGHKKIISIPVDTVEPTITTDKANAFGIKELIGTGYSEFQGSIPGRIHNVALAANRFNGVLIPPGETMSFNKTLGDVSAATGYQQAYIIKEGRTVLGDGGGVCQVSSTLFRAALNAGLPIAERWAHAYRVHYYEEGGIPAGMDATVFDPSNDLKIKNDTPGYILVQTKTDLDKLSLIFELYGQKDGRISEVFNHKLTGITPPPPDRFDDDPTLNKGIVRQVDFAAWGAKASFQYKVTRGTEILQDTTFYSNYRPWQAIYLRGTKE
jgi:vancomycin resistance protein YoaR